MSGTTVPSLGDYLNLASWAYQQIGSPYPGPYTTPPAGYSFLTVNGAPLVGYDAITGFYGAALVSSTGQIVIDFEGTNIGVNASQGNYGFALADILDDLSIAVGGHASAYDSALSFAQKVVSYATSQGYSASDITLTGHSLGGAEVEYVAAQTGLSGVAFAPPGIAGQDVPASASTQLTDYADRGDPVANYAQGGNVQAILLNGTIVHVGSVQYIGSYTGTAILQTAVIAYIASQTSSFASIRSAGRAALLSTLTYGFATYHPLSTYASDLGISFPIDYSQGAAPNLVATSSGTGGATEAIDLPGLDVANIDIVGSANENLVITPPSGQSISVPLSSLDEEFSFSLSSDGHGGTLFEIGAASDGFVIAGAAGVAIQGDAKPLYVIGGKGSVAVSGGTGNMTVVGSTSASATTDILGGAGQNLLEGGAGATTIAAGTGATTAIGGSGTTWLFANGSAPDYLVAGSGITSIVGATGSGPATIFAGSGADVIGLGSGPSMVVGGAGIALITGGSGQDAYGFINDHAGGAVIISNFKPTDTLVFAGYQGDPIVHQAILHGSALITLSDNTEILLFGVDRAVF